MMLEIKYDIKAVFEKIIPSRRVNNEEHIETACLLKNSLIISENELKGNLEQKLIKYKTLESVVLDDEDKNLLIKKMYNQWFYRSSIYEELLLSSDKCCYCFINRAVELDHFFNKSEYSELAISAINLVPSCSVCNGRKKQNDIFVQPYFEEINEMEWLVCHLEWKNNNVLPIPKYKYYHSENMSLDFYNRLEAQINNSNFLADSGRNAVEELTSYLKSWEYLKSKLSESDFIESFKKTKDSMSDTFGMNSWQYQLYVSLIDESVMFYEKIGNIN